MPLLLGLSLPVSALKSHLSLSFTLNSGGWSSEILSLCINGSHLLPTYFHLSHLSHYIQIHFENPDLSVLPSSLKTSIHLFGQWYLSNAFIVMGNSTRTKQSLPALGGRVRQKDLVAITQITKQGMLTQNKPGGWLEARLLRPGLHKAGPAEP